MKRISYNVKCIKNKNSKINLSLLLAKIIFQRKEKLCYEKSANK